MKQPCLLLTLFQLTVTICSCSEAQKKRVEMAAQNGESTFGAFVGGAMEVANKKDPVPSAMRQMGQDGPAQQLIGHGLKYQVFRTLDPTVTSGMIQDGVTEVIIP